MSQIRLFALLLAAVTLTGCGSALQKVVREDRAAPGGWVAMESATAASGVSVVRGGRALDVRVPLPLQPGDLIETGPDTGAVLRLQEGEAVLGPRTRVRLGSLEVIFGRIFASVRGLFRAEDANVVADVEGTRFLFDSQPGRGMQVMVIDGAVRCSSKRGDWEPLRVTAGHAMELGYRGRPEPYVRPVPREEMEEVLGWAENLSRAPQAGYCCAGGRVFPALSTTCRGRFERSEAAAARQCERGWCCSGGRVSGAIRAECRGSFHRDPRSAERACAPPPGWCCANGQVWQTTREGCRGSFFGERYAAAKACAPPPQPSGWCCAGGEVFRTDKASCAERGGKMYLNEMTARRACVVIR